jgi:hypothetical protein
VLEALDEAEVGGDDGERKRRWRMFSRCGGLFIQAAISDAGVPS